MVNRPTPSYAGIMFGGEQYGTSANNVIDKTKVINSANHGIFIIESVDTKVMNSSVEAPCLVSADCGGIYTNARSLRTLSQQITYNTVTRARGQERIGIYLDDKASGVTVAHNTIVDNEKGMMVHSGYQNDIIDNFFASSRVMHISFPEDAGAPIHDNRVLRNIFRSTAGEQTYNMSGQSPATFGTFDYNVYQSTNPTIFARVNKAGAATTHSFAAWRGTLGQDLHSTMNGRP
jgi:hypothetical protein